MLVHGDQENRQSFTGLRLTDIHSKRDKPWWKDGSLLKLNALLMCALLAQTASGFDSSMLNGMQSLPQWIQYFGEPKGTRLGAMTFGPTGGILISILISSQLCDRYGRRYPICGGSLITIVGAVLQAVSKNYGMFVAARFIIGFGLGIVAVAAPPLLSELAYPTHRGVLVSLYLTTWPLGSLMAAAITYGTFKMEGSSWSWRMPSLLQCTFSLVQAVLSLFCPESPRWLIFQNRGREARDIFAKYYADGDSNSELVRFCMAEITATLEMEKVQKKSRWMEWLATKGNRHRLFIALYIPLMLQWSGNALISYYLALVLRSIGITDHKKQLILNVCLALWSFVVACTAALLVDKAGRRRLFLTGMGSMGVSYIIWTICSAINQEKDFKQKGYAAAVLLMIFIYTACYHMVAPISPTYIMEAVPYSLRSKASMLYQLSGNLVGIYNSFVNPVAMEALQWKYYIVWCVFIAVHFSFIYFFCPETMGRALEEVAEIFDGPDALSGVNAMCVMRLDTNPDNALELADREGGVEVGKEGIPVQQVEKA